MTIKTLSAIAIITAALASPTFAQDRTMDGPANHKHTRHFHDSYNQAPLSEPGYYGAPSAHEGRGIQNSFDPSDLVSPDVVPGN
jgi:hypothetical protein